MCKTLWGESLRASRDTEFTREQMERPPLSWRRLGIVQMLILPGDSASGPSPVCTTLLMGETRAPKTREACARGREGCRPLQSWQWGRRREARDRPQPVRTRQGKQASPRTTGTRMGSSVNSPLSTVCHYRVLLTCLTGLENHPGGGFSPSGR